MSRRSLREQFSDLLAICNNDEERDILEWLWGYYAGPAERNEERLARELGVAAASLQLTLNGTLPASELPDMLDAIANLKRRISRQKPLVHTVVVDRILAALDYCRNNSAMVYISGSTGRGKTYAAQHWARENNHGRTVYIRVPSGCTRRAAVQLLAAARGLAINGATANLEAALYKTLTPRNVIIIDEAGHLLSRSNSVSGAIELFRDIHDIIGCGVAFVFTDVYLAAVKQGAAADYYEQFIGRLEFPVEIPAIPRRDEVREVVRAYFGKADEQVVDYALKLTRQRDGKLRTLYKDLDRAAEFAAQQGRTINYQDLRKAAAWRQSAGAWPEDN